jgi:hypothetical protein
MHPPVLFCLLITILLFTLPVATFAQEADSVDALQAQATKVFLDCQWCDESFIRTEITFVNYVRDQFQADIHLLITTQRTGGGGQEYTITFIGQNRAKGQDDTLRFSTKQSDTQDEVRKALTQRLQLGLMRYAARTSLAPFLKVTYLVPPNPRM